MVSSTPAGSGLPIGLMPGALPSDHASRQTLKTTAIFLPCGQTQFTGRLMLPGAPTAGTRRGAFACCGSRPLSFLPRAVPDCLVAGSALGHARRPIGAGEVGQREFVAVRSAQEFGIVDREANRPRQPLR